MLKLRGIYKGDRVEWWFAEEGVILHRLLYIRLVLMKIRMIADIAVN
jgi:hypothetical protein